jgi:uncharacterized protein YqfA (UPF0365 family)
MKNVQADTAMRDSLASGGEGPNKGPNK